MILQLDQLFGLIQLHEILLSFHAGLSENYSFVLWLLRANIYWIQAYKKHIKGFEHEYFD